MPVLDASIWVSLCHAGDRHHKRTKEWIRECLLEDERFAVPTLFRVEVTAAIRRLTDSSKLARAALTEAERLGWLDFFELTEERSVRAAALAAMTGVRGADAVYLELAAQRCDTLITWDRQQLDRGRAAAVVKTP